MLIGIASFYLCSREPAIDAHARVRQFVIQSTLNRFFDVIVVLGDSIVEGSTLPRSICGHAIVNAGIGGTSTTSKLGSMLANSLDGRRAALIVVSLGTNDAAKWRSAQTFRTNYRKLLEELLPLTSRIVVMAIPPVENQPAIEVTINEYNSILPEIAKEIGATFVALPRMPERHTFDGVHLNAAGYQIWDETALRGSASICGSG